MLQRVQGKLEALLPCRAGILQPGNHAAHLGRHLVKSKDNGLCSLLPQYNAIKVVNSSGRIHTSRCYNENRKLSRCLIRDFMLAALGTVVVTSLSGVMMPGPMFTVTLAKSYKSPWAGAQVSLGHAVIEVPLILLIYFGAAHFFQNSIVQLVLSVLGGGMIVWMGVGLFRARREVARQGRDATYSAFVAGILMSGLNPFFLVWWVTVGSLLLMNFLMPSAPGVWGCLLSCTGCATWSGCPWSR